MKLSVRSQNFRLQEDTEEFAQRRLESLGRFLPNIREVRLELSKQDNRRGVDYVIAQITLTHERGAILRTEERAEGLEKVSIETAITKAQEKMLARIKRFKGKREAARTRVPDRFAATIAEIEAAEELPLTDETAEEEIPAVVVRRKHIPVETMNEIEAISQMELLGHNFFIYRDGESGIINIVYRRNDGDYGVLAPAD